MISRWALSAEVWKEFEALICSMTTFVVDLTDDWIICRGKDVRFGVFACGKGVGSKPGVGDGSWAWKSGKMVWSV